MKDFDIKILYEDDEMLAVNKPAGIAVHPDGKTKGPFLTEWITEKYPEVFRERVFLWMTEV